MKNEGLAAATCNHHIKLMKHSFNLAGDWEILLDSKNPVSRVPLFYEDNKIEHYMDDVELERLLMVLHNDENRPICQIALFLLASGVRLNELLSAKWSDVDMSKGVFTIRATNAKSKKLRGVPLNESAKEILNQLDTQGKFEYLFINRLTGMPYRNVHKVWNRLREKAGLKHLRLHDLRHQYASFLVNSGRTLYEVQQILGHSTSVVTQRYSHLSTKVLNEAAQSASVKIREATTNSV